MKHITIFSLFTLFCHFLLPLDNSSNATWINNEIHFFLLLKQLQKFDFSIEKIAGTFVLAKQRDHNRDRIAIQSSMCAKQHVFMEDESIHIYSGGPQGFAWKLSHANHIYTFNTESGAMTRHGQTNSDTIYDVIMSNEGIYIFGYQRWKKRDFIRRLGQNRNYFPPKSSCNILNDSYIRYISNNKGYALIEGFPYYAPSLLIKQNPYQIVGLFENADSDKRIAMSPDGQKYAIYSHPHFMLHDYALQRDVFYTNNSIPKPTNGVSHLLFAGTNDALLVHYDHQLIVISFEYQKHWQQEIHDIHKILPCSSIEKTLIQHTDGTFSYLNYNHENNITESKKRKRHPFEMIKI